MSLRLRALLPLVGGLGLMALALRSLIADILLAPSAPVLAGLQHLRPEKTAELVQLADDLEQSLAIQEMPAAWSALGLDLALQAEAAPAPARAALAERAAGALRASLRLAPANPYAWTRLAAVREKAGAPSEEILRYLRLSWETGPQEERLRAIRIDLALRHWPQTLPADRAAAFEDIRNAWAAKPQELLSVARTTPALDAIRAALVTDVAQLAAFEKALAKAGR